MSKHLFLASAVALGFIATPAFAQKGEPTIRPEAVRAHEVFLAGPALQGRGSATRDEAIAAAYVASQFESFGLKSAPGMANFLQSAKIVRTRLDGAPVLSIGGQKLDGAALLVGTSQASIGGKVSLFDGNDPKAMPAGEVVIATGTVPAMQAFRAASAKKVGLLIVRSGPEIEAMLKAIGGKPRMPSYLEGQEPPARTVLVALPAAAFDAAVKAAGSDAKLELPIARDIATTTNAVGWLPGTDPKAGVLLLSAHLDHLGVLPDGTVMSGANDDASGTTAVLELARALASGKPMKRGILFVAYGSEEIGGYGSRYFAANPPVPLNQIVANVEIEMIGAQDPKLPAGSMMMTGFERSTLGETLKKHGALVTSDPYPEQSFFQRSDNYSLALQGVVAHTISGWAVTPTYHSAQDTVENLDIAFMTRAIQSLVAPLRSLANSDAKPEWKPGGRPSAN